MVTHYSSHRKDEPGLSRTVFRLAMVFILLFVAYQAYPHLSTYWETWFAGEATEAVADQIQKNVEAGNLEDAASMLDAALEAETDPAKRKTLIEQRAELARRAERWPDVLRLCEQMLREFPNDPDRPLHVARYGEALEHHDRFEEARKQYEGLINSAPSGMRAPAMIGLGRIARREDKLVAARDFFRSAMEDAAVDSEAWNQALDAMGELNAELAFSRIETPESKYYAIGPGDNMTSVGIRLNTTQGLLVRANEIDDPSKLHLGQRLKYTPKDFRILIERSTCRLFLMDSQGTFKRYFTGLGMEGHETALGKYTVGSKQKDPTWFPKNRPSVPPGDPENELGTRWLPMVPAEEGLPSDLGIHGTVAPDSIGHYQSHGCPRMHNLDVEELYDLVVRSTPVEVVETIDWEKHGKIE